MCPVRPSTSDELIACFDSLGFPRPLDIEVIDAGLRHAKAVRRTDTHPYCGVEGCSAAGDSRIACQYDPRVSIRETQRCITAAMHHLQNYCH